MQETWVRFLVWEDLTCQGATKLMKDRYWACGAKLLKAVCLELVLHNKRSHRNEKPCTLQAESSPHLSQIEKWPHRKQTQCSQKKKKKALAFVSVDATAPLEGDVHFTRQRTQQEVEEKKNLLWEFANTKYLFSHRTLTLRELPKHDEWCGFLSVLVTADLGSHCWSFPTHLIFCY